MDREVHVRICEGLGVKFPRATRLSVCYLDNFLTFNVCKIVIGQIPANTNIEQTKTFIFREILIIYNNYFFETTRIC